MGVGANIRENLYCADCKNCRLLVWGKSTALDKMTNRGYLVEREDLEKFFLVRCLWLKENVINPQTLEKCEGKQVVKSSDDDLGDFYQ